MKSLKIYCLVGRRVEKGNLKTTSPILFTNGKLAESWKKHQEQIYKPFGWDYQIYEENTINFKPEESPF